MKVLWAGDIVGSPGRRVFAAVAKELKGRNLVAAIIANAENAAAGSGITQPLADELFAAGADILTLGDHTWGQKGTEAFLPGERRVVRPANYPPSCPGYGFATVQTAFGPLTVASVLGRVFMPPVDCPFRTIDALLARLPGTCGPVFVEVHGEATSEKIALGRYLDGRVAAVAGTHTHVPTGDACLLPRGTAYMTDLGMTGPYDSIIGREVEPVLKKFTTGMPSKFDVAKGPAVLQGAIVDIDRATGKALSITPFSWRETEAGVLESLPPGSSGL